MSTVVVAGGDGPVGVGSSSVSESVFNRPGQQFEHRQRRRRRRQRQRTEDPTQLRPVSQVDRRVAWNFQ